MKFKILILNIFLALPFLQVSYGQTFNQLWIEQGLSNNNVNTIFQDRLGFMWFGTYDGLNRYDGYTFESFRNKIGDTTSLPDKEVYAITEDKSGNIWVGTSKGVGILKNKTLAFSRIKYRKYGTHEILQVDQRIDNITMDGEGNFFICSHDAGLLFFKKNAATALQIPFPGSGTGQSINYTANNVFIGQNKTVYVLLDDVGLCRYNPVQKTLTVVNAQVHNANAIIGDNQGNLWIGSNTGLYTYSIAKDRLVPYHFDDKNLQNCRIYNLCLEKGRTLWMATDGEGLIKVDIDGKMPVQIFKKGSNPGSTTSNIIHTVFIDKEARKWIGTLFGGVNLIDAKKDRFQTISHEPNVSSSLVDRSIYSFCEDGSNIWIGSEGGGISVWNRKLNYFKNYLHHDNDPNSLSNDRIPSIIKDADGNIWIATYGGGVNRFERSTGRFLKIPFQQKDKGLKYAIKLFKDHNNNIWVCCAKGRWAGKLEKGLYLYDKASNTFKETKYNVQSEFFAIDEDKSGNLWLGGLNTLTVLNPATGIVGIIPTGTIVRAILRSHKGYMWVGTYGKGVICFDAGLHCIKSYTENEGLCNNTALNIEEDSHDNLWISTFNGLAKLNVTKRTFENFHASDGLQSEQFFNNASAHLSSGELIFGGIRGFNIFYPDNIKYFYGFPYLTITGIRIANTPINAESEYIHNAGNIYNVNDIVLPFDKAILSIDYVALEFSQPEKIRYAYYLEGWDKSWNYVGKLRTINYSRVNEGDYTLRIKSTNPSGAWNPSEKIIHIKVLPPWYREWYAYLLYFLTLSASVILYILYDRKQTELRYEIEREKLKVAQEKDLNEKKISFFTNISHELRTPLTLIVNPIKELLAQNGKNIDLIDISSVYRNTRRLLSMVDQLLLFRAAESEISVSKPEWLNLKDICHEVFLCFSNQVKAKNIRYDFICTEDEFSIYADREKIEIVLFNLLSNAIKFTPHNGCVMMTLAETNGSASIAIADTGPGIPAESAHLLFEKFHRPAGNHETKQVGFGIGLFLAKKLIEIQGGSVTFKNNDHKGTTFIVLLPDVKTVPLTVNSKSSNNHDSVPLVHELLSDTADEIKQFEPKQHAHLNNILGEVITGKPTILLIDDDVDLRQYVKQLLHDLYVIYEADNADIGFEIVLKNEPDIIVCDVVMPGTSGVEFCSKMKETESLSHIPIILLTSSSSAEIKLKGVECGADDYITKPFENNLLLARIKGILKGRNTLKQYFLNEITLKNNSLKIPEEYSAFLSRCIEIVEKHLDDDKFNVKSFALEIGMSQSNLFRKVKSISGLSVNEFIRFIRLRKAAELMIKTDLHIKEIAYRVGFQQVRYFREQFFKIFDINPSDFIIKHRKTFQTAYKVNATANRRLKHDR